MRYHMELLISQYYTYARSSAGGSQAVPASRTYAVNWVRQHAGLRQRMGMLEMELFAATLSA